MRPVFQTTICLLALMLSACEMKFPRAKTPSPPQPASAKAEPPPETAPAEPLSTPQTQVHLPNPQPIDPDALATPPVNVPAEPSKTRQGNHAGSKRQGPQPASASPAKPEGSETVADSPPATETQRPPIGPVLSDEERRRMNEEISSRLKDVDQMLGRLTALHLSESEKSSVDRIRSFHKLSHDALERGEIQAASALADRAVLLAQEVLRGR
jgi:predicted DNA-binding protein